MQAIDEERIRQIASSFLHLSFKNKNLVWNRVRQQRVGTSDIIVASELTELVNTLVGLTEKEFDFFCKRIEIPVRIDAAFPHH
jgi:hypothetical protein